MRDEITADGRPYYHGTPLRAAVSALLEGSTLSPLRPEGRSEFARSRAGHVYLTPSFNQAAEYGRMTSRGDWPEGTGPAADGSFHVFEFRLESVPVVPEEDELGFAVKAALCREAGVRHESNMNWQFAEALEDSPDTLRALASNARDLIAGSATLSKLGEPRFWTGRNKTAVGRAMLRSMDASLAAELVGLGISVATRARPRAVAAYLMPKFTMRPEEGQRIEISPHADEDHSVPVGPGGGLK